MPNPEKPCSRCGAVETQVFTGRALCRRCTVSEFDTVTYNSLRYKCLLRECEVAVAFSGGNSSLALLKFLQRDTARRPAQSKRPHISLVEVLHVDIAALFESSPNPASSGPGDILPIPSEQALAVVECARRTFDDAAGLESQCGNKISILNPLAGLPQGVAYELKQLLQHLTHCFRSTHKQALWAIEDLCYILMLRTIASHCSKRQDCGVTVELSRSEAPTPFSPRPVVLFGDSATRIVSTAIGLICKGAGAQIPQSAQLRDRRFYVDANVELFRPFLKFSRTDIELYLSALQSLSSDREWCNRPLDTTTSSKGAAVMDVNRLTEAFLTQLSVECPQAVAMAASALSKMAVLDRSQSQSGSFPGSQGPNPPTERCLTQNKLSSQTPVDLTLGDLATSPDHLATTAGDSGANTTTTQCHCCSGTCDTFAQRHGLLRWTSGQIQSLRALQEDLNSATITRSRSEDKSKDRQQDQKFHLQDRSILNCDCLPAQYPSSSDEATVPATSSENECSGVVPDGNQPNVALTEQLMQILCTRCVRIASFGRDAARIVFLLVTNRHAGPATWSTNFGTAKITVASR